MWRSQTKQQEEEEEEAGRAGSQHVSALRSESEEMASLKGPARASLIRQKWKKALALGAMTGNTTFLIVAGGKKKKTWVGIVSCRAT